MTTYIERPPLCCLVNRKVYLQYSHLHRPCVTALVQWNFSKGNPSIRTPCNWGTCAWFPILMVHAKLDPIYSGGLSETAIVRVLLYTLRN